MKVLVNALSAKMGGIVTYTANLMRSFSKRGIDATFAVPPEFPEQSGGTIIDIRTDRMHSVTRLAWEQTAWRYTVARRRPEILFSSANFGILKAPSPQVLLVREGGLFDPYYLTNIAPGQGAMAVFSRAARRKLILASAFASEAIIVPTAAIRERLLDWAPGLEEKVEYNHYGTLPDHFTPDAVGPRWRQDGTLRLLYVSAYYPHKMPGIASEAVARLNERNIPCRLTITMDLHRIASFPGGEKDLQLLRKGVERGQVDLIGNVPYPAMPALYRDHDLFLFPSVSETFGHPLIEAMSIGLPIVSADRPVNREVCGDAALYFEPFSISGLVERIAELDSSEDRRRELGLNGRKRSADMFGWEAHVDRLLEIFERVRHG